MKKLILFVFCLLSIQSFAQFDQWFSDQSLRMDFYHSGDKHSDSYTFDEFIQEDFWAGYGAEYAKYADEGSVPHWPPIAPIITWCKKVGIPISAAYAIAGGIAQKGTEGKHFWMPTVKNAKAILRRELVRAFAFYDLDIRVNVS